MESKSSEGKDIFFLWKIGQSNVKYEDGVGRRGKTSESIEFTFEMAIELGSKNCVGPWTPAVERSCTAAVSGSAVRGGDAACS